MARGAKTGGRQRGTPNRLTAELKEVIHGAFAELGGSEYLVRVGKKNPAVFCKLLGMTLPKNIDATVKGELTVNVITGVPEKPSALG